MDYQKTLTTARLTLRPPRPGDEDDLLAIHADPEVMRYFSETPWSDPERPARQIAQDAAAFAAREYFRFAIVLNETGRQIGNCTLRSLHWQNRRAEVGYALRRDYWGGGYMSEALRALLAFAFGELDLHRLEADIDPRNTGSTQCLERLGFQREGLLRERWIVGGEVHDSVLYGLLRREWAALTRSQ
ncbi:RimJ/RimL family protein N-acetyltransferase [Pseudoduganella flava]|uniref:GNAT family N-acetyltransferase n=1 Tax=Pseudoduganella flava TaxID=871742 RepID=A0A562PVB5_9BURK|nr:GNAT family N-acetyltransferase [Pseudoduganella flava]QGZ39475.1 GNAT family N-acetyltransferase [Pseudoduganella flava]TWI48359.1 RimJ/RimL family protein N-acetyltransferase [Pseudoduganella flava]